MTAEGGATEPGATKYKQLIESIRNGTAPAPPFITRFALPNCTEWSYGHVVTEFTAPPDVLVEADVVFGGYIASLIDQYAGLVMYSVLSDDFLFRTTELSVSFDKPLRPGQIRIEADLLDASPRQAVCDIRLFQAGTLISRGTVQIALRKPRAT